MGIPLWPWHVSLLYLQLWPCLQSSTLSHWCGLQVWFCKHVLEVEHVWVETQVSVLSQELFEAQTSLPLGGLVGAPHRLLAWQLFVS